MSRQIEHALFSLMPSYGSDLPPPLVELAGSLLAQSLHRASTLKAEEEVARRYVCAHIACDRLKITLDLPPIEPRPPVPPRIYKRLYTHLDNALPNPANTGRVTRNRTQSSKGQESPASSRPLPSRGVPTKETSLAQFRTSAGDGATTAKTRQAMANDSSHRLNPWIQPVIRFTCTEAGHGSLAPTVLAGIESILLPGGQRTEDEWINQHLTDLVAAIYFYVIMRLREGTSAEGIDREGYTPLRKNILDVLARARKEATFTGSGEDQTWGGWTSVKTKEFDAAVAMVNEKDWLQSDWYRGMTDVLLSQNNRDVDMQNADSDLTTPIQLRRADTMFQEKYDYLSEARREDFKLWKGEMLAKISELTAQSDA